RQHRTSGVAAYPTIHASGRRRGAKAEVPRTSVSISRGRSTMKNVMRMALMVGVAVGALWAVSGDRGYTQAADPNAAPNPYKMQDNWLQLPEGRQLGGAIKVQVDHSDGKSIWVFDRCSSNACNPIQKFDSSGKFVRGFGADMFNQPHGLYVDNEGNV